MDNLGKVDIVQQITLESLTTPQGMKAVKMRLFKDYIIQELGNYILQYHVYLNRTTA